MSMRGIAKAAVFPVPVCAIARTSSPFRIEGMDLNCMFVGLLKPIRARFFLIVSDIWYFSNFMDLPYFPAFVLPNLKITINYTDLLYTKACYYINELLPEKRYL
jgi:hypothetical protein